MPEGSVESNYATEDILDPGIDEISGYAVPVAAPSPKGVVEGAVATQDSNPKNMDNNSNVLCRDTRENWKMIPDPGNSGQYIICNADREQMTTVDELNAAQNNYRIEHGLGSLSINGKLCEVAAKRAIEISKNFSHAGFESAVLDGGLNKHSYGENIASGPLSGVRFVEWSWDKSAGHRENMLGDWTDGCGGVYGKYAVFLFAK